MPIEIERRFLVHGEEWKTFSTTKQTIRQGYLSTKFDEWITRIRIMNNNKAVITLKNSEDGFTCNEFEYYIPIKDAECIWDMLESECYNWFSQS